MEPAPIGDYAELGVTFGIPALNAIANGVLFVAPDALRNIRSNGDVIGDYAEPGKNTCAKWGIKN